MSIKYYVAGIFNTLFPSHADDDDDDDDGDHSAPK
jgi:hypothetical protein